MLQKERQNLYALLREYHEAPLPAKISRPEIKEIVEELETMKDKVVSMALSLARGDEDVKDYSPALQSLANKLKPESTSTDSQKKELSLVIGKVNQLLVIVTLAQK